jgi:F0F1-type ATP synthase membrane subunit b/b'
MRHFEADLELARQDNEDLEEAKENLEKELAKAKNDITMWKKKFEEEGQAKAEELEVARYVTLVNSDANSRFSTLMQTLASQLSCKLSLLNSHANSRFSTLMQTLASQLSSTPILV